MNKKKLILILISTVCFIGILIAVGINLIKSVMIELSDNKLLDTANYLTAVEVDSEAKFIMFFNKQEQISNIIYLNNKSVDSLYQKDIENKDIATSINLIIDNLNKNGVFTSVKNVILIDYGNDKLFSKVKAEFNKQFINYGISKDISYEVKTLKEEILSLNLKYKNSQSKNLKQLYNYSLDLINNVKNDDFKQEEQNIYENIDQYALNLYHKIEKYAEKIENQPKDSQTGIDVTTINATSDYNNALYALSDSWYYIENYQVYAYIHFEIDNINYDYCFKNGDYQKNKC